LVFIELLELVDPVGRVHLEDVVLVGLTVYIIVTIYNQFPVEADPGSW
jgi:hypothetical protein